MRATLYMGALVGYREFYRRLLDAGKPKKVALTACAGSCDHPQHYGEDGCSIRPLPGLDIEDGC